MPPKINPAELKISYIFFLFSTLEFILTLSSSS